jgi:ABC-2 type transport system permease protein
MTGLTGLGSMIRLVLRRDRVRLPVWLLAIVGLVYVSGGAVQGVYDTQQAITAYQATVGSSAASIALSGPPTALDTIAGITIFEINTTAIVAVALMAIFLVVRHTRAEEESGRTELLRAGVLGRYAPIAAPVLVVSTASVVVGLAIAGLLIGLGLPAGGSVAYGVSIAAVGLLFTAVATVAAQITIHARGALGLAGVVFGISFVIRALGDVADNGLSWASPIGWTQAVRPYDGDRWWPLAISLVTTVGLLFASRALAARRDLGGGLVAARPGSPSAAGWLSGPAALAFRLQRASVLGWGVGLAATGLAFGSFGSDVVEMVEANPAIGDLLGTTTTDDLVDAFLGMAVLILGLMASAFAIASALRMRAEEEAGRSEAVLGTAVSRLRWAGGNLAVTVVGTLVVLAAGGLGLGLARSADVGDSAEIGRLTGAALVAAPAALVLAALAVLLWGWVGRLALLAWAGLAVVFVLSYLGELLELPQWALDVSPFAHLPATPGAAAEVASIVVLTALAVGGGAIGVLGFTRRDVST